MPLQATRPNRQRRLEIAQETLGIIEQGHYLYAGQPVRLSDQRTMREGTQLFTEEDGARLAQALSAGRRPHPTRLSVTLESTFAAVRRLHAAGAPSIAALNFASAKNPGGGFLSGSQAQEEALTRASTLYASLTSPQVCGYYEAGRRSASGLYTHQLIYSPQVDIFRDDADELLPEPVPVNILTAAAPNAGALAQNAPKLSLKVPAVFRERAKRVLGLAALKGHQTLVLGAWGCGVFRNDPQEVAQMFAELLQDEAAGVFEEVVFAILDGKSGSTLSAFQEGLQ